MHYFFLILYKNTFKKINTSLSSGFLESNKMHEIHYNNLT